MEHSMNKLTSVIASTFCAFALVAAQAGPSPSKGGRPYPNELPTLKIYEQAKWNSLRPYVSTVDDIEKVLGKPVAVYDELLHTHVPGFQDDPDWTIVIDVVGEGGDLPDSVAGLVLSVELYPKKRVSLVGADFSAFRGATYTGRDEETTSYYDKFGLRYVVFEKDTANGRFHAGDLKRIIYGPSDETTAKYASKK